MLTLTDRARTMVRRFMEESEDELSALRIESGDATPGSASWALTLVADEEWKASDVEVDADGLTVLVARDVANLLEGATIDYVKREHEEGFQVNTVAPPPGEAEAPTGSVAAGATPSASPSDASPFGAGDVPHRPAPTEDERIEIEDPPQGPLADRIRELLETRINPAVAMHGGHIGLADIEDGEVFIVMSGGCQGCALSRMTLKQGVERMIRQEVPEVTGVHDVTDHEKGENPYYDAPI